MKIDGTPRRLRGPEKLKARLPPRVLSILITAAANENVTVADLRGGSRFACNVAARRTAAKRLRNELGFSLARIGSILGIDRSSVSAMLRTKTPPSGDISKPDLSGEWAI